MPAGAEPHAVLTRTLWLLVAAPLAGTLWHLAAAVYAKARVKEAPRGDVAGMLAIGGCGGSAVVHVAALARQAPGAFFVESLTSGARTARFDAPLALSLDPLATVAVALACLMALIAAVVLAAAPSAPSAPPESSAGSTGWRAWAWLELALAGAVLSFAADDPATMACGWSLSAIAGAWLAGWTDAEAAVRSGTRSAAGLLAFLLGTALLVWGLRGTWHGDDYVWGPDVPGRIQFARGMLASPAVLDALRDRMSPWGAGAGPELVPAILTLWVLAAWAMSGAPLRTPAPAPLVAVGYGATTAWLGPFLLARGAALFGMAPRAHVFVACVAAAMAVSACAQALGRKDAHPAGAWAPFAAASPGVLAWIALGASDGPDRLTPAAGAVVGGALATASLLLFAVWPGVALVPADPEAIAPRSSIGPWLERGSRSLGDLLLSYERWVIEATGRGLLVLAAVAAWAAMLVERDMIDRIGDAAASRVLRAARRLLAIAVVLGILGSPHLAFGAPPSWAASSGRIAVSLPSGAAGPLVLAQSSPGTFEGTLVVRNAGTEPLTISRLALRGDEEDVRSPARVSVRFADGAASQATLAPGASKNAVITWIPDRDAHVRQAFGHVVITSSDEAAGEVGMGFRAELPSGLGWLGAHALSFLMLWPIGSALLFVTVGRLAGWGLRTAHRFALASVTVEFAMALWAFGRFAADVGRASGNDGFQLVERFVWARAAGAEWYVGVDGASIALVLLAALVAFAVGCISRPETRDAEPTLGSALLVTGVVGVLVALDLVLFFAAWCLVWLALAILVGAWGGPRSASASAKLSVYALTGTACLLLAFVALSRASSPAFLVDGARVAHTLSIPELSRTSFAADGTVFGLPFVHAAWGLLLVAVAMATPLVPLHGWLPDVLEESPPGAGILVAGAVLPLGPYLLTRIGLGAVPEGARWAGASVATLAVIAALWASLCALVQTDLRRFAAYAAVSGGAMSLYGVASLTPEGVAGGGLLLFAHGLSSALLMGVAAAVARRVGRTGMGALSGLGREAPLLAGLGALGLGASAAVPGLAAGWGVLLVMLGGFVRYPILAFLLATALVVSAAAHLRFARAMILSPPERGSLETAALDPFGGRFPDATFGELAALLPLALLTVWLGLWPSPILSSIAVAAHDIAAAVDPTAPDVNGGR
jgi:NADH-quinone oxidoreductase subunit M